MKRIEFCSDLPEEKELPNVEVLCAFLEEVLEAENAPEAELNLIFTEDELVRQLNGEYRNKDKTTDVLSFPMGEEDFLGEVYVSIPQVEKQAPRFGASFEQELQRVCLHGILHILGYDHIDASDRKVMREKEESYLKREIY